MIYIRENTIALGWELAFRHLISHYINGTSDRIPTQYDRPSDPMSIDMPCCIEVLRPMGEPRIHKCYPGGWDDLVKYVDEVVHGSRDHLSKELSYTYHDRLINYPGAEFTNSVNQINRIVDILKVDRYTRRAQAITWIPDVDLGSKDPPCLQSLFFRIVPRDVDVLDMHVRFRSNDALNACYMNMYALTEYQKYVAGRLGIPVGHYIHFADSFHIYGQRLDQARQYYEQMSKRIDISGDALANCWTTEEYKELWNG